ncbi:RNA 2',3'-cyclic phosphodiesterase [Skermanella rosea]|uniref:RNA 2',3'-cyclic phosphodiesterase n=1 Tax=Skermanella cutis TaxID=2775420 RepID=A0ABX7B7G3_9PROT|nr:MULTISPECIES: RNA 2',3'-cyclic phosphodiesterase [Skermanella]QQP89041.1 RNA 2',3'-cyclic phosphodiesterase [Skermanella sp. TT6]UEM04037.1 RNA 2',3'-cyclic phosphodiesterase [Skermanella rosea]
MIRLFVALELPEAVRERLAGLGGGVPGARWTEPENLHLTVRFIGEVENGLLPDIDAALGSVSAPAFDLVLDGVGQFGSGSRSRVLWAGVERNDALVHLNQKVESALVRAGLPREERRYSPHVTLARLRDAPQERVGRFIQDRGLFRAGPIRVEHFTLFESRPGSGGPVYDPLREYPLG